MLGVEISDNVEYFVSLLMPCFSNSKVAIRQACASAIMNLMECTDPNIALGFILNYSRDEQSKIRMEVFNLITMIILSFPKKHIDSDQLFSHLHAGLKDDRAKVRYHALEACAVLAHQIKPRDILLTFDKKDVDLIELLEMRLEDQRMPYMNVEGGLEHIVSTKLQGLNEPLSPVKLKVKKSEISYSVFGSYRSIADNGDGYADDIENAFNTIGRIANEMNVDWTNSNEGIDNGFHVLSTPEKTLTNLFTPSKQNQTLTTLEYLDKNIRDSPNEDSEQSLAPKKGKRSPIKVRQLARTIKASSPSIESTPNSLEYLDNDIPQYEPVSVEKVTPKVANVRKSPIKVRQLARNIKSLSPAIEYKQLNTLQSFDEVFLEIENEPSITNSPNSKHVKSSPIKKRQLARTTKDHSPEFELDISTEIDLIIVNNDIDRNNSNFHESNHTAEDNFNKSPSPKRKSSVIKVRQLARNCVVAESSSPVPEKQHLMTEKRLREILAEIKDTDWLVSQKALGEFLECIPHHGTWVGTHISDISLAVISQVQNLRSTVSKIAIQSFSKCFQTIPKQMEPCLDSVASSLLKKVGEGNSFILEEIDSALEIMCEHMSPIRTIASLMVNSNSKNAQIRMRVSILIDKVISKMTMATLDKMIKSPKECERLLPGLAVFLREGLVETRNAAKHSLYLMSQIPDFVDVRLSKILNIASTSEVKEMLKTYIPKGVDAHRLPPIHKTKSASIVSPKKHASISKMLISEEGEVRIEDYITNLSSFDWQVRFDAIGHITELVTKQKTVDKFKLQGIFDQYAQRCSDGNSKVAVRALNSILDLIPIIGVLEF